MNASVNTSVANFVRAAAAHANFNMTLIPFNGTLGFIAIDPSVTKVDVLRPAIGDLFTDEVFSIPQACAYPISGQYGFLNRALYYCLILFAVLAASKSWLCWAALGIVMSYSAGACVHAFALFTRYRYDWPDFNSTGQLIEMPPKHYGDVDLQGIFPILVAGCIALPPILNWSYLLRGSRGAKPVVILWGAMMFAAVIPGLILTIRGIYPFEVTNQVTYCPTDAAKNCTFADLYNHGVGIDSSTTYDRCQCKDTCAAVVPSGFPFRHGQSLQAVLTSDRSITLDEKPSISYIFIVNAMMLFIVLAHGILSLIEAWWSQQHIRDTIFRRLSGNTRCSLRKGLDSKTRYYAGKYTAAFFFLSAIVVTAICPPLFISSVIINEIVTWDWPVAEQYDAVGQWGPLVAGVFAIVAATIQALSEAWEDRKSAKSKGLVSTTINQKRTAIKDLWNSICAIIQEFKYWFVEASLHDPSKLPKERERNDSAKNTTSSPHRTFNEVQLSRSPCDRCKDPARPVKYQCTDCDQGYCTACFPRTQKRGAHLEGSSEQARDPRRYSMELGNLESGYHSAASSLHEAPKRTPTGYTPLEYVEEGNFSSSLNFEA